MVRIPVAIRRDPVRFQLIQMLITSSDETGSLTMARPSGSVCNQALSMEVRWLMRLPSPAASQVDGAG